MDGASARRLSYLGFAIVVVVYLAIIQGGGLLVRAVTDYDGDLFTVTDVVLGLWIPLGAALAFTYGVAAWLGWLRPVLHDDCPTRRWVYVVPVVFLVSIVVAVDYGELLPKGAGFVLALLVATQLVGWGEEGMFRGLGVTTLRTHGLREGQVALWSSLVFGAVHLSNVFTRGVGAIPQALIVSAAGYYFYLTRRVSGGNVLNSVMHGLFDFALLSGTAIVADQAPYPGSIAAVLTYVVLAVVLLVRRRKIEPAPN